MGSETFWAGIVGALIGGGVALFGSVLNSWLEEARERKREEKRNLERLSAAMTASLEGFSVLGKAKQFQDVELPSGPMRELQTLGSLYFPAVEPAIEAFARALLGYHNLAVDSFDAVWPEREATASARVAKMQQTNPKAVEIEDAVWACKRKVEAAVHREALRIRNQRNPLERLFPASQSEGRQSQPTA